MCEESTSAAGPQAVRQDTAGREAAPAGPQAVRWDLAGREAADESTSAAGPQIRKLYSPKRRKPKNYTLPNGGYCHGGWRLTVPWPLIELTLVSKGRSVITGSMTGSKGCSAITGWVLAMATYLQTAGKGNVRNLYPSKRRIPKTILVQTVFSS